MLLGYTWPSTDLPNVYIPELYVTDEDNEDGLPSGGFGPEKTQPAGAVNVDAPAQPPEPTGTRRLTGSCVRARPPQPEGPRVVFLAGKQVFVL